jgi:hypothetical protein
MNDDKSQSKSGREDGSSSVIAQFQSLTLWLPVPRYRHRPPSMAQRRFMVVLVLVLMPLVLVQVVAG